jgi:hypothetical protein
MAQRSLLAWTLRSDSERIPRSTLVLERPHSFLDLAWRSRDRGVLVLAVSQLQGERAPLLDLSYEHCVRLMVGAMPGTSYKSLPTRACFEYSSTLRPSLLPHARCYFLPYQFCLSAIPSTLRTVGQSTITKHVLLGTVAASSGGVTRRQTTAINSLASGSSLGTNQRVLREYRYPLHPRQF